MRKTTTALTTLAVAGAITALGLAPSALAAAPTSDITASTSTSSDQREHRGHHGLGGRDGDRPALDTVLTVLDVTVAELREAREAGLTLADLAEQQGVEVEVLIDALVDEAEERITDWVNGEGPQRGEHRLDR